MKKFLFLMLSLFPSQLLAQSVQQNIVVIFDDSGSMNESLSGKVLKITAAKESLTNVLVNLPVNTNVGIVTLNGKWKEDEWFVPFGPVNRKTISENIAKIRPTATTPLGACMKVGCDVLLAKRAKQRYGIYRLLVVTDGDATDPKLVDKYTPDIMSRGVFVDVIGVGLRSEHTLATKVSSYKNANDSKQLITALQSTLAEVSYKDKASAEEDFNILSALPDNLPTKIIEVFAEGANQPIGEKPVAMNGASTEDIRVVRWVVVGIFCVAIIFATIGVFTN